MAAPGWLETISKHALISRDELMEWLNVPADRLRALILEEGFPPPRIRGMHFKSARITSRARWRVGDVRAWLSGSDELRQELSAELGSEARAQTKALRALYPSAYGFSRKQ